MAKEYIEREAALFAALVGADKWDGGSNYERDVVIEEALSRVPAADVEEVVRCKDCVNWGGVTHGFVCRKFSGIETRICMGADQFCSYGERKE